MMELGQVRKPLVIFVVQTIMLDDLYIAFCLSCSSYLGIDNNIN